MLDIIKEPNELLHQVSRSIKDDEFGEELSRHMDDMAVAMYASGGVGLAGPQVGDFRRIFVMDLDYITNLNQSSYGKYYLKVINPEILDSEGKFRSVEGCLSIPNFSKKLMRSEIINVRFQNEKGEFIEREFSGFASVVFQHETDHLNGITLLSKTNAKDKKKYLKSLERNNVWRISFF